MKPTMKLTIIASSIAMALATANAQATLVKSGIIVPNIPECGTPGNDPCLGWLMDSTNFTMLDTQGYMVGGTNDVHMSWDLMAYTSSSDYTGPGTVSSNVTMSSTSSFFGYKWTAHDIQMFMPGSYSFDVTLGGGNAETGSLSATVPSGDLGMHLLFDWNGIYNIDMFVLLAQNSVFGSGIANSANPGCGYTVSYPGVSNCLWDGPNYGSAGKPAGNKVWELASVDGNGDGVMGIPMAANGPFAGFNANFSSSATGIVPILPAMWLFGLGLLGLFGIGRYSYQVLERSS